LKGIRAKRPRLRLDPEAYRQLCREVLKRDGWRCQSCGRMEDLQVHHIQSRSRLSDDAEENLVTLCAKCRQEIHLQRQPLLGTWDSLERQHPGSSEIAAHAASKSAKELPNDPATFSTCSEINHLVSLSTRLDLEARDYIKYARKILFDLVSLDDHEAIPQFLFRAPAASYTSIAHYPTI
jgi:HNH endonuclease